MTKDTPMTLSAFYWKEQLPPSTIAASQFQESANQRRRRVLARRNEIGAQNKAFRKARALELRRAGWKLADIADDIGVTRRYAAMLTHEFAGMRPARKGGND
jgi:hypothetical protein